MQTIKTDRKNIIILYAITFAYFMLCAVLIGEYYRDDYWFTEFPKTFPSLMDFLKYRYECWSSRVIIEVPIVLLLKLPFTVWRFLIAGMFTGIAIIISYMLNQESIKSRVVTALMVAAFPLSYLNNAGWVTTTLNYIFPLFCLLVALLPVVNIYKEKKNSVWLLIISSFLAVFAANMEQTMALLMGFYIVSFIGYGWYNKKFYASLIPVFIVGILGVVFFVMCPGNAIRSEASIQEFLPRFAQWSLIQKVYYGAFHAINYMFFKKAGMLTFILMAAAYIAFEKRNSKKMVKLIAILEMIFYVVGNALFRYYHHYIPENEDEIIVNTPPAWIGAVDVMIKIFSVILFVGIIILVISLGRTIREKLFMLVVFGGCYMSAAILGFSPTIYASSTRIFVFMYYGIIFIAGKIFTDNDIWFIKKTRETTSAKVLVNNLLLLVCTGVIVLNMALNIWCAIQH